MFATICFLQIKSQLVNDQIKKYLMRRWTDN